MLASPMTLENWPLQETAVTDKTIDDMTELIYIGMGTLAFAAGVFVYVAAGKKTAALREENIRLGADLDAARKELDRMAAENKRLDALREERDRQMIDLQRRNASLEAELKSEDEKAETENIRRRLMTSEFEKLAGNILESNRRAFVDANRSELDKILTPLKERITEFGDTVRKTYSDDSKERFSLKEQIEKLVMANRQISDEAQRLSQALRGSSKVQGDWGEHILETMLEHSGLTKGREYDTQQTIRDRSGKTVSGEDDRKMRPDVIVYYPDDTKIVIDSKTSLTAYLRYMEAETDEQRAVAAKDHISSVRKHVNELAGKSYQDYVQSVDFVMMFIPNDTAYMLAMQQDPALWMDAYDRRVMIVSPMHLISVLKMVSALWKKEQQNINTIKIVKTAADIYAKLSGFCDSMDKVGKSLDAASASYEEAVKRLSTGKDNAIRKLEHLKALGVNVKGKSITSRFLDGNEDDDAQLPENTAE